MKNYFFYIIFLSLFLIVACKKKKEDDEVIPCRNFQDLQSFSYFKKGSYWIYKDSAGSSLDCVYVFNDTNYIYHNPGWGIIKEGDYQFYSNSLYSYFDGDQYFYKIDYGYYGSNGQVGTWRERRKQTPNGYNGTTFLMYNIFEEGSFINPWTSPGEVYYKGSYDTIRIEGIVYKNIAKFFDNHNASEKNESPTNFWVAKNIGIIRKEILDSNKIWNLIRYNVKQ